MSSLIRHSIHHKRNVNQVSFGRFPAIPTLPRSTLTAICRVACVLACLAAVCTPFICDNNGPGSSALNSVRSVARSTRFMSSAANSSTVSTARHAHPTGISQARRIANDVRAGRLIEMKDRPEINTFLVFHHLARISNAISLSLLSSNPM